MFDTIKKFWLYTKYTAKTYRLENVPPGPKAMFIGLMATQLGYTDVKYTAFKAYCDELFELLEMENAELANR